MKQHHYPGALPKIGNTIWYIVTCNNEWLGLLSFSPCLVLDYLKISGDNHSSATVQG